MKFIVTRMKRDMDKDKRIPKDLFEAFVRAQAEAGNAWRDAKNASDFSMFAPHLEKMIEMRKADHQDIQTREKKSMMLCSIIMRRVWTQRPSTIYLEI